MTFLLSEFSTRHCILETCQCSFFKVQFILRQTGETSSSAQNRRLAEAKSPKPQRRQTRIKKSMSFSGGAQSSTPPSRSPRLQNPLHGGILEEDVQSDPTYVSGRYFWCVIDLCVIQQCSEETESLGEWTSLPAISNSAASPNRWFKYTRCVYKMEFID